MHVNDLALLIKSHLKHAHTHTRRTAVVLAGMTIHVDRIKTEKKLDTL